MRVSNSSRGSEGRAAELLGVAELDETSSFLELEDAFSELDELWTFSELEDSTSLTLELDSSDSVELEYSSGSTEFELEESSLQAERKKRAQKGNIL